MTSFNHILIVRTDRMGDVVLTTPVIKALHRAYPTARISVLVTPATYDLINGNPYVDEAFVDDRQGQHKGLIGFLRLARDIRQRQFDVVFVLHTKRRYNLVCFLAGIPCRIGYKNNKFGFLLTRPLKDTRHLGLKHEARYCLDILGAVGLHTDQIDCFVPAQKEAEVWAAQWMAEHDLKPNTIIAIHPGASDPSKCWPVTHFAQLMDRLVERYTAKVVMIGGVETRALAGEILERARLRQQFFDLTGKTSVAQTVALLRRCRLLVSNDSGPVHVAAGVGIYVIALFLRSQPGINPLRWQPLGPKSFVLTNKPGQEVSLDGQGGVAHGQFDSITVDEVLRLVERIFH